MVNKQEIQTAVLPLIKAAVSTPKTVEVCPPEELLIEELANGKVKVKGSFSCQNLQGATVTSTFNYTLQKDAGGSWVKAGGGTKAQRDGKILAIEFVLLGIACAVFAYIVVVGF